MYFTLKFHSNERSLLLIQSWIFWIFGSTSQRLCNQFWSKNKQRTIRPCIDEQHRSEILWNQREQKSEILAKFHRKKVPKLRRLFRLVLWFGRRARKLLQRHAESAMFDFVFQPNLSCRTWFVQRPDKSGISASWRQQN